MLGKQTMERERKRSSAHDKTRRREVCDLAALCLWPDRICAGFSTAYFLSATISAAKEAFFLITIVA